MNNMYDNFIYCEKGALPINSCGKLINFFEDHLGLAKPGGYTHKEGQIDNLEITLNMNNQYGIVDAVNKTVENYKKMYPLIDTHLGRWGVDIECQLMRYDPNKYYHTIHCENDCYNYPSIQRCFAWILYLNDIKEGGGTEFIHQNITTKPRAGDMYIWPAGWTHMHRGVRAPYSFKYIITGWFIFTNNV
tara:strand:- start:678 stop:1244 length:567 start_codon:yes stop_codon:yes gene_type:complete